MPSQNTQMVQPACHLFAIPTRSFGRKQTVAKHRMAFCRGVILLALYCTFGCDNKSEHSTASTPQTPTSVAEVSPPRPIPDDALPFAEDEFNVVGAFPGPDDDRVALISPISVTFDNDVLAGQDLAQVIRVTFGGNEVSGSTSLNAADTLVFRPKEMWQPNTRYFIEINPELISVDGLMVNRELRWQFLTVADVYATPQKIIDLCMFDLDVEMLAAVNQARSSSRLCGTASHAATGKLTWNCDLQAAAISHSEDMATNNFFEHAGSDGSDVAQRILRTGYVPYIAGENLAGGFQTVSAAMDELLASPEHCVTLMAPEFTEFGFGIAVNAQSEYRHYWTQNFARPAMMR